MITSPLRYPGGKAKLYPFFTELIAENSLFGVEYCEPYAGGAGLALKLLANGYVERVSINDIDKSIYAFWVSALRSTKQFCALIEKTPITIEEWHRQKAIWLKGNNRNALALGFATYFLNRTNRSGIIEGAGPIGGFDQTGDWKVDARLVKEKQIENLLELERYQRQITITNDDALVYLKNNSAKRDALIYLDPPYYNKGSELYKSFYEPKDHKEVARYLERRRNAKWVVSYDDVKPIRDEYKSFTRLTYSLNYSAGPKTSGKEVIFLSDSIVPPSVSGFKLAA